MERKPIVLFGAGDLIRNYVHLADFASPVIDRIASGAFGVMTTVLVTGAGAIIGYAAVRLFKQQPGIRVIASDIYADAAGQYWADIFHQVPLTSQRAAYLEAVDRIHSQHGIDLIVPCIEQDVAFYNAARDRWADKGVLIALNQPRLIELCSNKLRFHNALVGLAPDLTIPSLATAASFDDAVAQLGPVLLAKPMIGYARKHHVIVSDRAAFDTVKPLLGESHFLQQFVGQDDMEFTVAVYGDGEGGAPCQIQLQRRLSPAGATQSARVVSRQDIDEAVLRLCQIFKPLGPTNLQFRLHKERPLLLEINPRLSSSLSIRAKFGFNDCDMLVEHLVHGVLPRQPSLRSGMAMRYIEDIIVTDRDHL